MSRKAKDEPTDMDLTRPVPEDFQTSETDCIGKEWEPNTVECKVCADSDLCCVLFGKKTAIKVKELEASKESYFLDRADFDAVPIQGLQKAVEKGISSLDPVYYEDLYEAVSSSAKISDKEAIEEYLRVFMQLNGYKVQDGYIIKK